MSKVAGETACSSPEAIALSHAGQEGEGGKEAERETGQGRPDGSRTANVTGGLHRRAGKGSQDPAARLAAPALPGTRCIGEEKQLRAPANIYFMHRSSEEQEAVHLLFPVCPG